MTRLPNVSQFLSRMSLLEPNVAAVKGSGSRPEFKHRTRTHEPSQVGFTARRIPYSSEARGGGGRVFSDPTRPSVDATRGTGHMGG